MALAANESGEEILRLTTLLMLPIASHTLNRTKRYHVRDIFPFMNGITLYGLLSSVKPVFGLSNVVVMSFLELECRGQYLRETEGMLCM